MSSAILLVEDNDADAALLARAARKAAITANVVRVGDGEAAIHYLEGTTPYEDRSVYPIPSVILLDIKLPGINGFELLLWLRRQPAPLNRVPIVMLTSSEQQADINRSYELGANSYLQKPDQHDGLISLLHTFHEYWFARNSLPEVTSKKAKNA
jgi:CheY-like chemotaxis protein